MTVAATPQTEAYPRMSKIQTLTEEQRARMPELVRQWCAIGLDTRPADRAEAEAAVPLIYQAGGLPPPSRIQWHLSPMAMCAATGTSPGDCLFGQHDASWLAFYAYMAEVLELRSQTAKLEGLWMLARSCGWAVATKAVCHLSERPSVLHRDNAGRLHAIDGPALAYPDGNAIFAVRGVRVPREWVEGRRTLDPLLALNEPNIERRAAAATLIGWERVLEQLSPVVVDVETSPEYDFGKLLRVDLPGEPGQQFLQVLCPTGRTLVIRVPPTMRTAREANAWTYPSRAGRPFAPQGRA